MIKTKKQTRKRKTENAAVNAQLYLWQKEEEWKEYLKNNRGDVQLGGVIRMIISLVIGSLLLAALYFLFKDVVIPEIQKRVMDMFNPPARP